jgi:hypothetical protein
MRSKTAVQYGGWRPLGPANYGGKVYDLAVDPKDADVVYAAYGCSGEGGGGGISGGGLWRTWDGGRTWRPAIDRMRDVGPLCVKIHPAIAGYLAVGSRSSIYNQDRGLLLSRDGGETCAESGQAIRASILSLSPCTLRSEYPLCSHPYQ